MAICVVNRFVIRFSIGRVGGNRVNNTTFFETIIQPKGNVYIFPIIIVIVFLVVIGLLVGGILTIKDTDKILPIIIIIITLLIPTGVLVGVILTIKNINISIKDKEVIINSFIYGRKIPIENILVNEIKTINLTQNKEYNPYIRTNGISIPNFHSGWMRLNNGKKALIYLTNMENVLLIPTKNFVILFSMEKSNEFINKIKEIN
jgi:hypothetical protein